ncbi:uncharacterized protein BYT42DRAFT_122121 [Radiomyces spectabilis]|uniref:uncharacterized protein n=1 Tax=Radiomyces spectabilis TaxID=64574 RepID=UPI00221F681E|nr:uncharacterized protein BYT42DRAFT_122121 [Radiomyces spectabilis]KAI8368207.1 hypothetical protein BYT42DRAFT_122121 [Radiomyces spectabilis]
MLCLLLAIALDYVEETVPSIMAKWDSQYRKKRHDQELQLTQYPQLISDLHAVYRCITLALDMPCPDGSPLAARKLKARLQYEFCRLLQQHLPALFADTRKEHYIFGYRQIEGLALEQQAEINGLSTLYSPSIAYTGRDLQLIMQIGLEEQITDVLDPFSISDELLRKQCDAILKDKSLSIDRTDWGAEIQLDISKSHLDTFSKACKEANEIQLGPDWFQLVREIVQARLQTWDTCWSEPVLRPMLQWFRDVILPWLSHVLIDGKEESWFKLLRAKIKCEYLVYKLFYETRVQQLFDIFIEYPTSLPAFEELQIATRKLNRVENVKDALLKALRERLLHQGASATDILQQYISCIRFLKGADPSCGVLVPVVEEVQTYMRDCRKDVVPAVVDMIRSSTEEDDLFAQEEENIYVFKEEELDKDRRLNDEYQVIPERSSTVADRLKQKSTDLVVMLISACGDIQSFIKGYKEKLAEALLASVDFNVDEEMIKLELLKQRFPEHTMNSCDVMIKDIGEGRRLDRYIHGNTKLQDDFHAVALSKHYWPEKDPGNVRLIPQLGDLMSLYETEYRNIKASRRLEWLPSYGTVTLELEFRSRTQEFIVTPVAALIISLFHSKDQVLSGAEIAEAIGVPMDETMAGLDFWMKKDVLFLTANGGYQLLED